jgi:hypothetical protein
MCLSEKLTVKKQTTLPYNRQIAFSGAKLGTKFHNSDI